MSNTASGVFHMLEKGIERAKHWARCIKRDVVALWLASSDNRVPWYAKAFAGIVAAYALSPIDLIPDFIPVLGYLDDLILVPLGILAAIRLIPAGVFAELREMALELADRPVSRAGLVLIVGIWIIAAMAVGWLASGLVR